MIYKLTEEKNNEKVERPHGKKKNEKREKRDVVLLTTEGNA